VQVIVGREDTWRLKPHPDPLLHGGKGLGAPVDRCLSGGRHLGGH